MNADTYPDAVEANLVGTLPGAGGCRRCHPERAAADCENGSDDCYCALATYAEAAAFCENTPGAEKPLALIRQVEYIEPKSGEYRHMKELRIAEWPVEFLRRPRRTPNTIPEFLSQSASENRVDILRGLVGPND